MSHIVVFEDPMQPTTNIFEYHMSNITLQKQVTAMMFAGQCTTHWLCLHAYYILEVLTTASLSSCVSLQPAFFLSFLLQHGWL